MIRIERKPVPATVREWLEPRSAELQQLVAAGADIPTRLSTAFREPRVKSHFVLETYGKCAYCESKITQVYWGDIEHIKPQARFPQEALSPINLTLACAPCNNAKGAYWDDDLAIVDPYTDEPSEFLFAFGYFVQWRLGSPRGRATVARLMLNRAALLERRKERIEMIAPLADQYATAPEGALKEVLRSELVRHIGPDSEYAMVVRAFLRESADL